MDISKIFSESFNDILSNPKVLLPYLILGILVTIIAVVIIAYAILSSGGLSFIHGLSNQSVNSTYNVSGTFASTFFSSLKNTFVYLLSFIIVISLISFIISIFVYGTIIALVEQIKTKTKVSVIDAFKKSSSKYISLLVAGIIISIIGLVSVGIPLLLGIISFVNLGGGFGIILGLILIAIAVFIGIILSISFFLINPLIIIEGTAPIQAIKKSYKICYNKKGDIFILFIIIGILEFVSYLIMTLVSIIPILGAILAFLIGIFISTWFIMVPVYFYYDLKNETAGTTVTPIKTTNTQSTKTKVNKTSSRKTVRKTKKPTMS